MQLVHPITNRLTEVPTVIIAPNGTCWQGTIPESILRQCGWCVPVEPLPVEEGYVRVAVLDTYTPSGDGTATRDHLDRLQSDIDKEVEQAQAQAAANATAQVTAEQAAIQQVIPFAQQYRTLLRKYFGDNAEINRDVTRLVVLEYFANLTATNTIIAQQIADGALLQTLFAILLPLANDSSVTATNTWNVNFWNKIPIS